jgi:tetratricopeptide (TPR) repeat protein
MGVFAALAVGGAEIRAWTGGAVAVLLTLLISAPHYGATLLRVYEHRAERRKYFFFAVHVTLAVAALFVAAQYSIALASWLLTIYLIWSPWHYTGQNYGLASMLLRRRGVPVSRGVKRLLYASFASSYLLLFAVVFTGSGAGDDIARGYGAMGHERLRVQNLGIPEAVRDLLVPAFAVAYAVSTVSVSVCLLRVAKARALAPAAMLVLTQALWFSLPMAAMFSGIGAAIDPLDPDLRGSNFLWIALGHAVQYLWVTSHYARSEPGYRGATHYLAKTLLAGTALWTLPLVAFAPRALGGLSGDAGYYLLMASCINIHHFILDGAIWKLRDSRIASVLLRDAVDSAPDEGPVRRRPLRIAGWAIAGAGALLATLQLGFETRLLYGQATGSLAVRTAALDGLAWFGRDSARERWRIAKAHLDAGDWAKAATSLRRSLDLEPDLEGFSDLAHLESNLGDHAAALAALEAGLELDPNRLGLLHRAGEALLELGRPDLARSYLERAVARDPGHAPSRRALAQARAKLAARNSQAADPP